MFRFRHLAGALLAGAVLWASTTAVAQAETRIELTEPSASEFPRITFFASVIGSDGFRIHALPSANFSLTEDGLQIEDFTIAEQPVGGRQIFALNTVEPLRRRDPTGVTRFDLVRRALVEAWSARPPSSAPDDLSLLTNGQSLASHLPDAGRLVPALESWPVEFAGPEAGYDVLLQALTAALDPLPHSGMETSVVFLTPLLDRPNEQALADARSLAETSGAKIHAVLVGTPEQAGTAEALRLRQTTEATGGSFRVFDPAAGLEELESVLQDTRSRYAIEYSSPAATAGPHAVELSLTTDTLAAVSPPAVYTVRLEPPQAAFVQPPTRIVRETDDPDRLLTDIPPTSVDLPLLVTFSDGHPRTLTLLRFLVDGAVVETREAPPFDAVTWDVSAILESSRHLLQVEVTDSQGLVATTEIVPVSVEVIPGPRGLEALRPALAPLAAGVGIVGLGVAVIAAWLRLGEITADPGWSEPGAGSLRALPRASLGGLAAGGPAEAFLVPLRPDGSSGPPIGLQGGDLTVGSDPALCSLLLDDASVSGIHARLTRRAAGNFTVRDQHSTAGTWVNDEAVDEGGRDLHHGDRIYFGRAAYRFRLAAPGPEPRIIIRPKGAPRP